MLPQYSDKTSKSKCDTRLDKISNTIKGGNFLYNRLDDAGAAMCLPFGRLCQNVTN